MVAEEQFWEYEGRWVSRGLQTVVNVKRMYFTKVTQWLRITQ